VQTGVAAGTAWWFAHSVLGHPAPLSAPVVAIVSIGATVGNRRRRMLEVILGISAGVGIATLLVTELGRSAPLLGLLVASTMFFTLTLRGGELLATQSAVTAILVFGAGEPSIPAAGARCLDALVGGTATAIVSLLVVPLNPALHLDERLQPLLHELTAVLADIAGTLTSLDAERGERTLQRARDADRLVAALHNARAVAIDAARFAPVRRRSLGRVRRVDAAAIHIDHVLRHTRVLARAALAAAVSNDPEAGQCAVVPQRLGHAVDLINAAWGEGRDGRPAVEFACGAAGHAAGLQRRSASVVVAAVAASSHGIADDLALAVAELFGSTPSHVSHEREMQLRTTRH
jgi:uncharacterized membrane protein YgaE (UPF0421/DUF939 family)